jgi:hypothetical protein
VAGVLRGVDLAAVIVAGCLCHPGVRVIAVLVPDATVNAAARVPKRTTLAVDRPTPVSVTVLPPAMGPATAVTAPMDGGGR